MLYEYQTAPLLEKLRAGETRPRHHRAADADGGPRDRGTVRRAVHARRASRPSARRARAGQARGPARTRRCCCSRTGTACATTRSRSAAASGSTTSRTTGRPASRRCARWSRPGTASRCCPSSPRRRPVGTARGLRIKPFAQAGPGAHDRRGVAQVHDPRQGDRRRDRDHPRNDEEIGIQHDETSSLRRCARP
ncbi:MAG: hypothetical protein MZV70_33845 [Desulfobacterales bacterium]|nr:hypothetical protein [Desulfobacterales bacterium]